MPVESCKAIERFTFKSNSVFESMPEKVKQAFFNQMLTKHLKKGQSIFIEGSYPSGIYYIKKGKIKKYKTLNRGKEQIIYLCGEGELLGYAALLAGERYPDSAATLTDAIIGFISEDKLNFLLSQHDELSKMLIKNLSHEFGVLVNFITTFTQKTVRERVALTLLILHDKFKDNLNEKGEVQITLTREDFANIVGIAIETLVRFLHDFKEEQIIETHGRKIYIKSMSKLLDTSNINDYF